MAVAGKHGLPRTGAGECDILAPWSPIYVSVSMVKFVMKKGRHETNHPDCDSPNTE